LRNVFISKYGRNAENDRSGGGRQSDIFERREAFFRYKAGGQLYITGAARNGLDKTE
jgi:hypothetical protein